MVSLRVSDLMSRQVVAVRREDDLATLRDLMIDHDIRHVPVVDPDGDLVGLVSHRDLLRAALIEQPRIERPEERSLLQQLNVDELMTETVVTIEAGADIRDAATLMLEHKFGCLPVTEDAQVVGILTESDFVHLMAHGE